MRIAPEVLEGIRRHLTASYPAEGCGFLVGARRPDGDIEVSVQLPVANARAADGEARRRFLIGPDAVRTAERVAAAAGLVVVGAYHSHPDAPARPSAYDAEHAWPWYCYLIVSVVVGAAREVRVYELRDDRSGFVELALQLKEA